MVAKVDNRVEVRWSDGLPSTISKSCVQAVQTQVQGGFNKMEHVVLKETGAIRQVMTQVCYMHSLAASFAQLTMDLDVHARYVQRSYDSITSFT